MTAAQVSVTLRPRFPLDMSGRLWEWLNNPREPNFDDFGAESLAEFMMELGRRVTREKTWAIMFDGEVVGYLAFAPSNPVFGQFHGLVINPEFRRLGIGTEAFREALALLLDQGFKSFMVMPFADNTRIFRILENVGFREAGRILHASERDGEPVNVRLMTRGVD